MFDQKSITINSTHKFYTIVDFLMIGCFDVLFICEVKSQGVIWQLLFS